MAAAETTTETEQERIERWRAEELERAGYEASAASLLAGRADVDLHYAIDLLRTVARPSSRSRSCSTPRCRAPPGEPGSGATPSTRAPLPSARSAECALL